MRRCVARSWLLGQARRPSRAGAGRTRGVLGLSDDELIAAAGGRHRTEIEPSSRLWTSEPLRAPSARPPAWRCVCRCDAALSGRTARPEARRPCCTSPAASSACSSSSADDPVAIVGARRASPYGLDVARSLGRSLARAGMTVVSGMALGVDSAAHAGALEAGAPQSRCFPGRPSGPIRRAARGLTGRSSPVARWCLELPCGATVRRWGFRRATGSSRRWPRARWSSRRASALAHCDRPLCATSSGRPVGAVPGRITSPQAAGPTG